MTLKVDREDLHVPDNCTSRRHAAADLRASSAEDVAMPLHEPRNGLKAF